MKILCVCLSTTIQRTVIFEKLSLEKVNRSTGYIEHASGKAINSARVLNQLEKNCAQIVCPVGKTNEKYFLDLAKKDDLTLDFVETDGNTRQCWTLLDKSQKTTTELVVSETSSFDYNKAELKILKIINDLIPFYDAVLLSGSRPKGFSPDLYSLIAKITRDNKKLFLADYICEDLINTIETAVPDFIKINDEEFFKTFNASKTMDEEELKNAVTQKSVSLHNMIIVTRGEKSTYAANNGSFYECPVQKVEPVNTTACGDSFNAGFLYEYLKTGDFYKALEKGTWCAAKNAESEIPGSIYQ